MDGDDCWVDFEMGGVPAVVDVASVSSLEFVGSVTHNFGDLVGFGERPFEELAIVNGESGYLSRRRRASFLSSGSSSLDK